MANENDFRAARENYEKIVKAATMKFNHITIHTIGIILEERERYARQWMNTRSVGEDEKYKQIEKGIEDCNQRLALILGM